MPTMEGPLRRKTLLKEGRKPAVSAGLAGRPCMREHWGRRSPQNIGANSGVTPSLASALHGPKDRESGFSYPTLVILMDLREPVCSPHPSPSNHTPWT